MNLQDICCVQLPQADKAASICMMDQEIPGTKVICHVLQPGDVITTGTPKGVGGMQAGDTIEIRIGGIGSLINTVEKEV